MNCLCLNVYSITDTNISYQYYVYWTVHHLDSWIKIDQLMSLGLFFAAQHVSNASTFIFRSLDCVWVYCSGSMCVGVTVWFGWGDVVSLCRLVSYVFASVSNVPFCLHVEGKRCLRFQYRIVFSRHFKLSEHLKVKTLCGIPWQFLRHLK